MYLNFLGKILMRKVISIFIVFFITLHAVEFKNLEFFYLNHELSPNFEKTDFNYSMNRGKKLTKDDKWFNLPLAKILKKNYEFFCDDLNSNTFLKNTVIPKILHFIWLGSPIPDCVKMCINSWVHYHPDYEIKIWDDHAVSTISWYNTRVEEGFKKSLSFAEKADYIRIQVLYDFGGIYVDSDFICLKSFNPIVESSVRFFAGFEKPKKGYSSNLYINNALIGAQPKSDVIRGCFSTFIHPDEAPRGLETHIRTGPNALSKAIENEINYRGSDGILILPCTYFYPTLYDWNLQKIEQNFPQFKMFIKKETMAIHLWALSWK
jgi:hypothetical protein